MDVAVQVCAARVVCSAGSGRDSTDVHRRWRDQSQAERIDRGSINLCGWLLEPSAWAQCGANFFLFSFVSSSRVILLLPYLEILTITKAKLASGCYTIVLRILPVCRIVRLASCGIYCRVQLSDNVPGIISLRKIECCAEIFRWVVTPLHAVCTAEQVDMCSYACFFTAVYFRLSDPDSSEYQVLLLAPDDYVCLCVNTRDWLCDKVHGETTKLEVHLG